MWASQGTDAWYVGPLFDHYHCNHYFVPDTRAYWIYGSAELFPQHCQVPFLLWNENFQEVIDELAMTLNHLPPERCARFISKVFQRLQSTHGEPATCTLTAPSQERQLPREDIQLNPYIPPAKQRVEQITPVPPPDKQRVPTPSPIQRITDAPPIMNAPNPTEKRR